MRADALGAGPGPPRRSALSRRFAAPRGAAIVPFALALLLHLAPPTRVCTAGAWLRAPGEAYVKAALFRARGEEEFDAGGSRRALFDPAFYERGRYQETGASLYGEYGLGRDATLFGDVLLKFADAEAVGRGGAGDVAGAALGIPDVRIGLRLPVARRRIVAAFEPSVAIPIEPVGGDPAAPRIGAGTAAFAGALSVGAAIPARGGYAQVGGGYRARSGKPPGEWFWDAEGGLAPTGALRVRLRYDGVKARAVRAMDPGAAAMSLAAESGSQDAHRVAPAFAVAFAGGHEVSLAFRRTFAGRSALRGTEWELAYAFLGTVRRAPTPPARPPD